MRFSVRRPDVCPGEEKRTLRKSAFCMWGITKKRILRAPPHEKVHSGTRRSGRVRLSVRPDSEPRSADPGASRPAGWRGVARARLPSWAVSHSAPQAGGGLPERICPVEPLSIVPRSLAGGLPHTSRAPRRHGKAQSARSGNRRVRLSVSRSGQNALFREASEPECAFP